MRWLIFFLPEMIWAWFFAAEADRATGRNMKPDTPEAWARFKARLGHARRGRTSETQRGDAKA